MRAIVLLGAVLALSGCEKLMRDMYDSGRVRPLQRPQAAHVPDGAVERVQGVLASTTSGRAGGQAQRARLEAEEAQAIPYPVTMALLERGRERFEIYCVPCHSPLGDGDGLIARRSRRPRCRTPPRTTSGRSRPRGRSRSSTRWA